MKQDLKIHIAYIATIIILVAIVVGEFYYFNNKLVASKSFASAGFKMMGNRKPPAGGMGAMNMSTQKAPVLSDQQKQQIADGVSTASTEKTFNITGGNYYFIPNKITVNKGDQVTFIFTNAGGIHDLVIDELNVKTPISHTAEATTVTFTATKVGSFVYYCSLPGHKQKGMWGTLTVK